MILADSASAVIGICLSGYRGGLGVSAVAGRDQDPVRLGPAHARAGAGR